jgi:hypothetical protein
VKVGGWEEEEQGGLGEEVEADEVEAEEEEEGEAEEEEEGEADEEGVQVVGEGEEERPQRDLSRIPSAQEQTDRLQVFYSKFNLYKWDKAVYLIPVSTLGRFQTIPCKSCGLKDFLGKILCYMANLKISSTFPKFECCFGIISVPCLHVWEWLFFCSLST